MKRVPRSRPGKLGPFGPRILASGAVFLLVVLLITSLFGKKGLMEIQRTRKVYATKLVEMEKLEGRKARLLKDISELERDPRAVEREARQKLWLMKKDEVVIVSNHDHN